MPAKRSDILLCALALVLAVGHFAFLFHFFAPAISTPDANGYFAQGRLIASQHQSWFEKGSPLQFVPTHWSTVDGDRYFSKYPPSLPVIVAAVYRLYGPEAALLVKPAIAGAVVLLAFTGVWALPDGISALSRMQATNAGLVGVARAVQESAPPGSIVMADRQILQHLDYLGDWHLAD